MSETVEINYTNSQSYLDKPLPGCLWSHRLVLKGVKRGRVGCLHPPFREPFETWAAKIPQNKVPF